VRSRRRWRAAPSRPPPDPCEIALRYGTVTCHAGRHDPCRAPEKPPSPGPAVAAGRQVRFPGILLAAALIGAGGFIASEALRPPVAGRAGDRCAEATTGARQAFEAGPMARAGLHLTEIGTGSRVEAGETTTPGPILCRAEAQFSNGAKDTLWFALVPATGGGDGQFMVHAAPGDLGRRNVMAMR